MKSPLTLDELATLKRAVELTDEGRNYLRLAGDVLEDQAEGHGLAAIQALNGQEHDGRALTVNEARPRQERGGAGGRGGYGGGGGGGRGGYGGGGGGGQRY